MVEPRKAGEYEIFNSIYIGEKEIVIGELPYDSPEKYLCAYFESNGIIGSYSDCMVSDNYAETMMLFADRIREQAGNVFAEIQSAQVPEEDKKCVDSSRFSFVSYKDDIENARVLFIRDYPSYIKDSVIWELTDSNRNMIFNFDIIPVSTQEAQKFGEKQALGIETNISNYQRKQNMNNNYTSIIPYDMEQQRKEIREFLDDLTTRDQKMFKVVMTVMHTADTLEQLNSDTDAITATGIKHMCQIGTLKFQQLEGLNATLPIGINRIQARRTLTTESLAVFMPFKVQEIQHKGGSFQGLNVISKNMIFVNRKELLNGNAYIGAFE